MKNTMLMEIPLNLDTHQGHEHLCNNRENRDGLNSSTCLDCDDFGTGMTLAAFHSAGIVTVLRLKLTVHKDYHRFQGQQS